MSVTSENLSPVVLIPGITGNGIQVKQTNSTIPECGYVDYSTSPYRLWIQLYFLLPHWVTCWVAMLSLKYSDQMFASNHGMEISMEDFGGIKDIDYLDYTLDYGVYGTKYMADVTAALIRSGYVVKKDLFGAPYDWRMPVNQPEYFQALKELIEKAVQMNQRKAIIVAHSQGSAMAMYFMHKFVDDAWIGKHIARFVPINGVFGGSFNAVKGIVSGYRELLTVSIWGLETTLLDPALVRDVFRSFGSSQTLLPSQIVFGSEHIVLSIQGQEAPALPHSFSLKTWSEVLRADLPNNIRSRVESDRAELESLLLKSPGVPVSCMWSAFRTCTTDVSFKYAVTGWTSPTSGGSQISDEGLYTSLPIKVLGFGDNTVPERSASLCSSWPGSESFLFADLDHQLILSSPNFISSLVSVVKLENQMSKEPKLTSTGVPSRCWSSEDETCPQSRDTSHLKSSADLQGFPVPVCGRGLVLPARRIDRMYIYADTSLADGTLGGYLAPVKSLGILPSAPKGCEFCGEDCTQSAQVRCGVQYMSPRSSVVNRVILDCLDPAYDGDDDIDSEDKVILRSDKRTWRGKIIAELKRKMESWNKEEAKRLQSAQLNRERALYLPGLTSHPDQVFAAMKERSPGSFTESQLLNPPKVFKASELRTAFGLNSVALRNGRRESHELFERMKELPAGDDLTIIEESIKQLEEMEKRSSTESIIRT